MIDSIFKVLNELEVQSTLEKSRKVTVNSEDRMRQEFNRTLGKVRYVHVEREKVTQMVIYTKRNIVYFAMEPEMPTTTKIRLITKIKRITADL